MAKLLLKVHPFSVSASWSAIQRISLHLVDLTLISSRQNQRTQQKKTDKPWESGELGRPFAFASVCSVPVARALNGRVTTPDLLREFLHSEWIWPAREAEP